MAITLGDAFFDFFELTNERHGELIIHHKALHVGRIGNAGLHDLIAENVGFKHGD